MKILRCISTAVLACLVLAVPASAAEVNLTLSPTSTTLGGAPITATASGVATSGYGVSIMTKVGPCSKANAPAMAFGANEPGPFNKTEALPATGYPAIGTYEVCAQINHWEVTAEATFAVLAVLPPAPVVTPAASVVASVVHPVVKPLTAAQKLHAALAKCKRQKHKAKRAKCERAARKAARHR